MKNVVEEGLKVNRAYTDLCNLPNPENLKLLVDAATYFTKQWERSDNSSMVKRDD